MYVGESFLLCEVKEVCVCILWLLCGLRNHRGGMYNEEQMYYGGSDGAGLGAREN